ncbi:uncharacterized protein At4g10930 isoform X2 [Cynara cardunculus var. scolymus]|uniref:uncharacterized protein At4g10930 isoform X2 n=1 Tax=Cynara cardunculus var. scolymus TaxID=59895 RepID=UPI000D62F0C7|nr:uncharacterized protein At4g10930 isoform X2 [Cynara cardunculus var. scolymus]
MEFELFTDCAEDDYAFGAEVMDNEPLVYDGDEGQRCGICMDVVVDRGVLDCCQHWFCFSCIDNWASITNLCPLCQNEFQLITCVPVYDTIGSIQPDDDGSYSRDEDWCVEGKSNTLSFPSYYIDENAVSCLEGDSCKIRGQSANVEEDPNLDTSIACDSCDLWYHAICVGFDPEGSCESSWLCPRCSVDETLQKLEVGPSNNYGRESSSLEHLANVTFPMNVSVSVADAGETAVVVSIIDGNQQTQVPSENMLSSVTMSKDLKIGNQEKEETNQIVLPGSDVCEDMGIEKTSSNENCKLEKQLAEKIIKKPKIEAVELDLPLSQVTASTLVSESSQLSGLSRNFKEEGSEPSVIDGLRTPGLYDEYCNNKSLESGSHIASSVDPLSDEYKTTGEVEEKNVSRECRLPADKNPDKKEKAGGITGAKRKQRDYSAKEGETKAKMQNSKSAKIVKTERSRVAQFVHEANESVPDGSKNLNTASCGGSIVRKRKIGTDIRDIVQGTYHRSANRLANLADKSSEDKETSSGLRIKKIVRRATEDKESSVVVQSLRKEIRDAIRNRSSKELGENLFDPKLLSAFRTALAGQTTETNRPPPLDVKAKKALLQKGTVRENLTKKIYGIGGKRKRAWTRDCEIEFWKHRCSKVSKPEKIETLKSVLDLLRKGPEVMEIKKESIIEAPTSILSRLYVADASVFPRKNDIKPLSALEAPILSAGDSCSKPAEIIKSSVQPTDGLVDGGSSKNTQKESSSGSNNIKVDKKKWALEVLARKTAVSGNNSSQGQDNAVLKGNYPLLAKLPADMRPILAPSRHNKIPISIRQAQLYRLTEHFLKKTNLPVSRPTAEIELAVADAINVEKSVADRSNSKLVYVNLCSQELLNRSDNMDSTIGPDLKPTAVLDDNSETATNDVPTSADVDEALRNAGLLSDSPPDSPYHIKGDTKEDGPDNVFEIDSQPELDIYGDFEYDLEDDDFVGAGAIKTSKLQEVDTKIKMVFSTFESDRSDSAWRSEDLEAPIVVENSNEDNTKEKSPCISSLPAGEEEILGECEELYGPDKEPLVNKYPAIKSLDLITENNVAEVKDDLGPNLAAEASELPNGNCSDNSAVPAIVSHSSGGTDLPPKPLETVQTKEKKSHADKKQQSDKCSSVFKKVEAYIKEHIRPLCKSGVITVDQYRWAVGKTTDKIMKYHSKDTNANFLIKEGEKVKKLAQQYVEAAQKVENNK